MDFRPAQFGLTISSARPRSAASASAMSCATTLRAAGTLSAGISSPHDGVLVDDL